MRLLLLVIGGLTLVFGSAEPIQAQTPLEMIKGNGVPNCAPDREVDRYCRKSFPWAIPICGSLCDDYIPKKLPCAKKVQASTCDDYSKKTLPQVCLPRCSCGSPTCRKYDRFDRSQGKHSVTQRRVISTNRSPFIAPFSIQRQNKRSARSPGDPLIRR